MAIADLTIRPAIPADALPLSQLAKRVFLRTYGAKLRGVAVGPFLDAAFSAAAFTELIANSDDYLAVAVLSEQLIGYLRLANGPLPAGIVGDATLELAQLYLDQQYHGRGAGAALLHAACQYAQSIGAAAIWLCAWEQNERALRFYQKSGFRTIGRCEVFVDQIVFEDLVMLRTLDHTSDSEVSNDR